MPHPTATLVILLALVAGCRGAQPGAGDRLVRLVPEEREVLPRTAADVAVARRGRELLDSWSARVERPLGRVLLAAFGDPRGEPDRLVRVFDPKAWPGDAVVTYVLLLDARGRLRLLQEAPASLSGDRSLLHEHLFDEKGETLAFRRTSGFSHAGCGADPARESSTAFFGPSGRIVRREYRLADAGGKRLDPKSCALPYEREYAIHANARSLLRALGLEQTAQAAGVRLRALTDP
jgi:hypothetical protein